VSVGIEFTDDVEAAGRRHAEGYAFTFGAMGSATTNFYNDAFARQGYGDDVREVQRLWLAGDRDAARQRVPIAIGLGTNLIGTDDLVRNRLRRYRDAGVATLRAQLQGDPTTDLEQQLDDLARLLDLVGEVNAEVVTSSVD
jgi:alkanesulfonate monooxygenase SsuD/methylene tetrahydromethanopterin reductase-like flavin-dependent oxidoreductase (luciferase family)